MVIKLRQFFMKKITIFALSLFIFTVTLILTLAFFNGAAIQKKSVVIETNTASSSAVQVDNSTKKTVGLLRELYPDRLGLQLADGQTYFFTFSDDFQVNDNQDLKIDQKIKLVYQGDLTDEKIIASAAEVLAN